MSTTNNLQIKKGDTIKVISGRDKGKIGEIIQILRTTNQVIVMLHFFMNIDSHQ